MADSDFVENEVVTPKLDDKREVNPESNNSQTKHCSENHTETVKEELFETPKSGSTRESITTITRAEAQRHLRLK